MYARPRRLAGEAELRGVTSARTDGASGRAAGRAVEHSGSARTKRNEKMVDRVRWANILLALSWDGTWIERWRSEERNGGAHEQERIEDEPRETR